MRPCETACCTQPPAPLSTAALEAKGALPTRYLSQSQCVLPLLASDEASHGVCGRQDELREMVNAPRTTAAESQPLTEREKEKEAVRAAERSAADAPAPKSMYQSGDQQFKGTEWSDEAKAAVADFQGLLQLVCAVLTTGLIRPADPLASTGD